MLIQTCLTDFAQVEFVRKEALIEWVKKKISTEQGFESGEAEYGYKSALEDLINYLNE